MRVSTFKESFFAFLLTIIILFLRIEGNIRIISINNLKYFFNKINISIEEDMILVTVIHLLLLLVALSLSTATSFEQFGLKLYSTVSQNKKNENIFLSPASISLAMSMCTVGARQDRKTLIFYTFSSSFLSR